MPAELVGPRVMPAASPGSGSSRGTVGIPRNRSHACADAGRAVRVRDWVRRWTGAFLEPREPSALELVGR